METQAMAEMIVAFPKSVALLVPLLSHVVKHENMYTKEFRDHILAIATGVYDVIDTTQHMMSELAEASDDMNSGGKRVVAQLDIAHTELMKEQRVTPDNKARTELRTKLERLKESVNKWIRETSNIAQRATGVYQLALEQSRRSEESQVNREQLDRIEERTNLAVTNIEESLFSSSNKMREKLSLALNDLASITKNEQEASHTIFDALSRANSAVELQTPLCVAFKKWLPVTHTPPSNSATDITEVPIVPRETPPSIPATDITEVPIVQQENPIASDSVPSTLPNPPNSPRPALPPGSEEQINVEHLDALNESCEKLLQMVPENGAVTAAISMPVTEIKETLKAANITLKYTSPEVSELYTAAIMIIEQISQLASTLIDDPGSNSGKEPRSRLLTLKDSVSTLTQKIITQAQSTLKTSQKTLKSTPRKYSAPPSPMVASQELQRKKAQELLVIKQKLQSAVDHCMKEIPVLDWEVTKEAVILFEVEALASISLHWQTITWQLKSIHAIVDAMSSYSIAKFEELGPKSKLRSITKSLLNNTSTCIKQIIAISQDIHLYSNEYLRMSSLYLEAKVLGLDSELRKMNPQRKKHALNSSTDSDGPAHGRLQVTVVSANGVKAADSTGKSDPYAILMGRKNQKSPAKEQTLYPKWDYTFPNPVQFEHASPETARFTIVLWDKDFGSDDYLGQCEFVLSLYIGSKETIELTQSLVNGPKHKENDIKGTLTVRVVFM